MLLLTVLSCSPTSRNSTDSSSVGGHSEAELESPENLASAISRLNQYRTGAKLGAVEEDRSLSKGDHEHAQYLAKNHINGSDFTFHANHLEARCVDCNSAHGEAAGGHGSTTAGGWAGIRGWVIRTDNPLPDGAAIIDQMMSMPFVALVLLDPQLDRVGIGATCVGAGGECIMVAELKIDARKAAHLYVGGSTIRARTSASSLDLRETPQVGPLEMPIRYPSDDSALMPLSYDGGERPDPLASCPGYSPPTGAPITIQLGMGWDPSNFNQVKATAHSLSLEGREIEHCEYNWATYTNPIPSNYGMAQGTLTRFGAFVIVPQRPMVPGKTYRVSITVDSKTYTWSFSIASPRRELH